MLKPLLAACAVLGVAALAGGTASAPASLVFTGRQAADLAPSQVSSNWAGYAEVAPDGATPLTFTDVTGTWTVPKATCVASRNDAVAFWVGLGGYSGDSNALEQLGTAAQCDGVSTTPTYYAWWEIVPAASVQIPLKVKPGDRVTAAVVVKGQTVTLYLKDITRKTRFLKTETLAQQLDVSSAEWIAEAPASCSSTNRCRVIPLTDFGNVTFTNAAATIDVANADGTTTAHSGTLTDPAWETAPIELISDGAAGRFFNQGDILGPGVGAVPGTLTTDGRGFSVAWQQSVTPPLGG